MEAKDHKRLFADTISALFAQYGRSPDREHKRAYWDQLRDHRPNDVQEAARCAARESPNRLPSAPYVREHCQRIVKMRRLEERVGVFGPRLVDDPTPSVPTDEDGAEQYIAGSGNPYEQLARRWEVENARTPGRNWLGRATEVGDMLAKDLGWRDE